MTECIAGCQSFDGGEKKHHKDCPYYNESLTKFNADEIERLRKLLAEAADDIEDWGSYAGDYFCNKHNLAGDVKKYRDASLNAQDEHCSCGTELKHATGIGPFCPNENCDILDGPFSPSVIDTPNLCPGCDGSGTTDHPITMETQGPEKDAEKMAWSKLHQIECGLCRGTGYETSVDTRKVNDLSDDELTQEIDIVASETQEP